MSPSQRYADGKMIELAGALKVLDPITLDMIKAMVQCAFSAGQLHQVVANITAAVKEPACVMQTMYEG